MTNVLQHYWSVWLLMATNAIQETFVNRAANVFFMLGKLFRFSFMMMFLVLLKNNVSEVGGYSTAQMLVFYVTYQIIDTILQTLYRGVYEFGATVRNGQFDAVLSKPINPLFRILTGTPDINDAIFLIPTILLGFYLIFSNGIVITVPAFILYLALLINGFLIGTALHIFIVSFTLLTTDIDNIIWMYRDLSRLGQFPVNLYFEFFRLLLFFVVPIGIMITIPAQALLSVPLSYSLFVSFAVGIGFFLLSLWTWNRAEKSYSSASS